MKMSWSELPMRKVSYSAEYSEKRRGGGHPLRQSSGCAWNLHPLMMEAGRFSAEEIVRKNGFGSRGAAAAFVRPGIRTVTTGNSTHS
jgi:hypothetical protein